MGMISSLLGVKGLTDEEKKELRAAIMKLTDKSPEIQRIVNKALRRSIPKPTRVRRNDPKIVSIKR